MMSPEIDPVYLLEIRKLRCLACGAQPPSEAHHVRSRGAGGKDDFWNIIPLCTQHHTMGADAWHRIGSVQFVRRFPWVLDYLNQLGWEIFNEKLIPPIKVK